MKVVKISLLLVIPTLLLAASSAGAATFQGLGDLPGGSCWSEARAVSADGFLVVGMSSSASGVEAFRWTALEGMVGLGDLPGGSFYGCATGASADGSVVAGRSTSASGTEAFRWTAGGGMAGLGYPAGDSASSAADVSADGSVVVGTSYSASGAQAFRWTAAGGMVGLGVLSGSDGSEATGVSADGSVVVGNSYYGGDALSFRWTADEGMSLLDAFYAYDVSGDGSFTVGQFTYYDPWDEQYYSYAVCWTAPGGMGYLSIEWPDQAGAYAVSPDASVTAGMSLGRPVLWIQGGGQVDLNSLLAPVLPAGWTLDSPPSGVTVNNGIVTMVGGGTNPTGDYEAYIATFPFTGQVDLDGDGVPNHSDNCPTTWNPDQTDSNGNGIGDACETCHIIGWRSVRSHAGLGELGIVLDPKLTGTGPKGPTVESRGTAALGMGVRVVDVDFDAPITLMDPAAVTVTCSVTSSRKSCLDVSCAVALSMLDADTMRISLSDVPDQASCAVSIGPAAIAERLTGDTDCMIRSLVGDVDTSGSVNSTDIKQIRYRIGFPVTTVPQYDLNLDGVIDAADVTYAKSRNGKKALCP